MERELSLPGQSVRYTLTRSHRSRRVRLAVYRDGRVLVTIPWYTSEKVAERFLAEKIDWLAPKLAAAANYQDHPIIRHSRPDYRRQKAAAVRIVQAILDRFCGRYGFRYRRLSIRNQRTRWGSCSKNGTISINYKIIYFSDEARDYIVAHELCHLKEFNHSPKFWRLVGQMIPEYARIRREINRSGLGL